MICLPPLLVHGRQYLLPAADSSGHVLAELLLAGEGRAAMHDCVTATLAGDPMLTLWALVQATPSPADEQFLAPRSRESLATWLIDHAHEALAWPEDFEPPATLDGLAGDLQSLLDAASDRPGQPASWLDDLGIDAKALTDHARRAAADWQVLLQGIGRVLPLLARRIEQWRELQVRFNTALEHEKIESLAELAAGAGHEINNPLTVISGRAQLLLRGEADPERRHDLALISAQAMRVNEMIADMRLFARPPEPKRSRFDLAELIDRLAAYHHEQFARLGITFERCGRSEPTPIDADPTQVEVALRAICRNAVEAIGGDGNVSIALHLEDESVHVTIADDGPGITDQERRHLFDPFYSARQAGRGLGLGLSKAWRIVTAHGGRIEVASEPGHGTTFRIDLPR